MDPLSVAVHRGPFVESVHVVHAVAVGDGTVVAEAGDPAFLTSLRSSAKPFQALPLVRSRDDLDDGDIAIASASHRAEPEQIEAVRRLLAKAPATAEDLEVGIQEGRPPQPIFHNCSGKHAGMLAACRARGWQTQGYRLAGHPLQDEILSEVAAAAELEPSELETAVDGCGVVCFALPLERVAFMFSRLENREGGGRVAAAMRAHPALVAFPGALDTELMAGAPVVAKIGAEAVVAVGLADGRGLALKVADGSARALDPATVWAAREVLGLPAASAALDTLAEPPLLNSRGVVVGRVFVAG